MNAERAAQRAAKRKKADDARFTAIRKDPQALIDGWKCPICKNEFRDSTACPHSSADVEKANDRFMLERCSS